MRRNALCLQHPFSHHHTITAKLVTDESNHAMDYLPHPFSGQSQATHHQPEFHRRPRPSALRSQRRLSRRILRRCSPHRAPSNLRGYLRPPACRGDFRIHCSSVAAPDTAANPEAPARPFAAPASPCSKVSAAGSRYPGPGVSLALGSASAGPAPTMFIAGESRPHHCFGHAAPSPNCLRIQVLAFGRHLPAPSPFAFVNTP